MSTDSRSYIKSTLRKILSSVVRIMLRNGITYREFCEVSKEVFVEVASKDYGIRGRETNVSRVSVLTGIDRKEVKRVKDLLLDHPQVHQAQQKQDRITRVLTAWHQDTAYLNQAQSPLILPIEGQDSFTSLAKAYAGDVPIRALLKEMLRVGVVEEVESEKIKVLKREFIPAQSDPEAMLRASSVIHDLGSTLHHNLYEGGSEDHPLRFERRASNIYIDPEHIPEFREFVAKEGQAFLECIDAWLSEHEVADHSNTTNTIRAGVSTFAFEEKNIQPTEAASKKPKGASPKDESDKNKTDS